MVGFTIAYDIDGVRLPVVGFDGLGNSIEVELLALLSGSV
jgi:hypothetical protein